MQRRQEAWSERQRLVALLAPAIATMSSKTPDLDGVLASDPQPPLPGVRPEAETATDNAALEFALRAGARWPFFRDASLDGTEQEEPDTRSPYDDW